MAEITTELTLRTPTTVEDLERLVKKAHEYNLYGSHVQVTTVGAIDDNTHAIVIRAIDPDSE